MSQLGDNIVKLRKKAEMTQSALGEKLSISPQAVSKWEKGLSEPDTETLKNICDLFNVSMDDLVGARSVKNERDDENASESQQEKIESQPQIIIGYCSQCKKPLHSPSEYEIMNDGAVNLPICINCATKKKHKKAITEYQEENNTFKKSIIWGVFAGVLALAIILGVSLYFKQYVIAGVGGVLGGYMFFAMVSQAFWGDFVDDCLDFFRRSFEMPGLIFELDLDGIIWFITVKLLLGILSGLLSVICYLFGVVFTGVCSIFTFPFAIVKERNKIKSLKSTCTILAEKLKNLKQN